MADRFQLMILPPQSVRSLAASQRRADSAAAIAKAVKAGRGLYAATPGTGPDGETCGSCRHLVRKQLANIYRKCGLCRPWWTGGGATDVKARSPACSRWEAQQETPARNVPAGGGTGTAHDGLRQGPAAANSREGG